MYLDHYKIFLFLFRTNYLSRVVVKILDADKGGRLESSPGRVASRDIVQFVPFRDVQSKSHYFLFS